MKKLLIGLYILITIAIVLIIGNSGLMNVKDNKAIDAGEKLYQQQCVACHGKTGKGEGAKDGTALNNQNFLSTVSDKDLFNYVKYGREGTVMPAYAANLSENDLNNLVAFMRNWQKKQLDLEAPEKITGNPENGEKHYRLFCASCHGIEGVGKKKMGTVLASPQYLQYTSDEQIWIGTAYGREDTRMGPSLKGLDGVRQFSEAELNDIVVYIRSLQSK